MPHPATVLVVEDDLSTQGLLVAIIKHLGLNCRTAGDGHAAMSMIAEERPSVIVLDLIMPEMDGFAVLRELKRSAPDLLAKTIVVTAAAIRNMGEVPELAYAWKFLRKPLDIDQLGAAITGCISQGDQKAGHGGAYETPPRP
jgi:two-component system OmpR family response regulator